MVPLEHRDLNVIASDPHSQAEKRLTDFSQKDAPWDQHRAQSQDVETIYAGDDEFKRYASRVHDCSTLLEYAQSVDESTGELSLKLRTATFCRVRHCPVCQWRRSLMWQARFYQAIPELAEKHPASRWAFLTLTVRNCHIKNLGEKLSEMNKSWNKLIKRKDMRHIKGWIRTTEVTRSADGSAHPHFHVLLMLSSSYFKTENYLTKMAWVAHWQSALNADYEPNIDIRTVKSKTADATIEQLLQKAVKETLKYSVKPSDMTADPAWMLELTRQLHKKRFIASGGVLKDLLKPEDEVTDEDLILGDDPAEEPEIDEGNQLLFSYRRDKRYYVKTTADEAFHGGFKPGI